MNMLDEHRHTFLSRFSSRQRSGKCVGELLAIHAFDDLNECITGPADVAVRNLAGLHYAEVSEQT